MSYQNKNNIILLNKKKGYTLLEITIVIILFSIIILSIIEILNYVTITASRTIINNEVYINGKLSIEFLTSEIERYSEIDMYTYSNGKLEKIIVYQNSDRVYKDANVIYYFSDNSSRNNCIYFGGVSNNNVTYTNKFSKHIDNVVVTKKLNIINLNIRTVDKVDKNDCKSYSFNSKINIENKNINFYIKSIDT